MILEASDMSKEMKKGATAVSLSVESIEKAASMGADFLVVHHPHGFWNNEPTLVRGALKARIKAALEKEVNLFAFHLPMDGQAEIGNNAVFLKKWERF